MSLGLIIFAQMSELYHVLEGEQDPTNDGRVDGRIRMDIACMSYDIRENLMRFDIIYLADVAEYQDEKYGRLRLIGYIPDLGRLFYTNGRIFGECRLLSRSDVPPDFIRKDMWERMQKIVKDV